MNRCGTNSSCSAGKGAPGKEAAGAADGAYTGAFVPGNRLPPDGSKPARPSAKTELLSGSPIVILLPVGSSVPGKGAFVSAGGAGAGTAGGTSRVGTVEDGIEWWA